MRHTDALSIKVNLTGKDSVLSRETIRDEQKKDDLCQQYKQFDNLWTDKDGVLYRQGPKEPPRVVIPTTLVPAVLTC
jgi:hypothetical protein